MNTYPNMCAPTEAQLINSIQYVINIDKGTVTAIMENCRLGAFDALCRCNNGKPVMSCCDIEAMELLMLPDKLVATVRCCPEDDFDVKIGKRLARKKLCAKFDRYRQRAWNKYHNLLMKRLRATSKCIDKHYREPRCNEDA